MKARGLLRVRLSAALLAGALSVVPAMAWGQGESSQGEALSGYLRTLATSPNNVEALIGAGNAAIAVGDPRAAVTFFGRADEARPNDGRVKAGLGAAMVHLEQPQEALTFFAQALQLGVPAYAIGAERGLAYDMLGDPRRAQQDYRAALQHDDDAEVRQRLALSLAIGGDRQAALDTIDRDVRAQDRAAWRTRAFILALTGDANGATEAAAGVMPEAQAQAMRPFFASLPTLSPADRAMAVHFGEIPSNGRSEVASGFQSPTPSLPLVADQGGQLNAPAGRLASSVPPSNAPRRRPGASDAAEAATVAERSPPRTPQPTPTPTRTAAAAPLVLPQSTAAVTRTDLPVEPPARPIQNIATAELPPSAAVGDEGSAVVAPAPSFAELAATIARLTDVPPPKVSAPAARAVQGPGLAANDALPPRPTAKPAEKKVEDKKTADKKADEKKAAKKAPPKPVNPGRHWVQIAGGANKGTLPKEFAKLKGKAPKLLGGRAAYTATLRATNRLLIGPFKSEAEAQAFVNQLNKADLSAFSWTSDEGEEVVKLAGK